MSVEIFANISTSSKKRTPIPAPEDHYLKDFSEVSKDTFYQKMDGLVNRDRKGKITFYGDDEEFAKYEFEVERTKKPFGILYSDLGHDYEPVYYVSKVLL